VADNREIIRAVIKTTTVGAVGSGLLSPEQFDAFYELAETATPWAGLQRVEKLENHNGGIPRIDFGTDVIRPATEGVDSGYYTSPTHDFITYAQVKGEVSFKLTRESKTQAASPRYEQQLIDGFTRGWGRSKQKLNWLGDTVSVDPMLRMNDGWRKLIIAGGLTVNGAGINAGDIDLAHFQACYALLPEAWKQRVDELRWALTRTQQNNYLDSLSGRATGIGDWAVERAADGSMMVKGIPAVDVPALTIASNQDNIVLTSPKNTIEVIDPTSMSFQRVEEGITLKKQDAVAYVGFFHSDAVMAEVEGAAIVTALNN
jgi:hypothetical protein